ncbi:hypothetical protein MNV49_005991 [Pseudohyphozyma bogoriensis]|nr:hypothetical protein MNV49_005991 [Pseudohyphozyma bogoriensis]
MWLSSQPSSVEAQLTPPPAIQALAPAQLIGITPEETTPLSTIKLAREEVASRRVKTDMSATKRTRREDLWDGVELWRDFSFSAKLGVDVASYFFDSLPSERTRKNVVLLPVEGYSDLGGGGESEEAEAKRVKIGEHEQHEGRGDDAPPKLHPSTRASTATSSSRRNSHADSKISSPPSSLPLSISHNSPTPHTRPFHPSPLNASHYAPYLLPITPPPEWSYKHHSTILAFLLACAPREKWSTLTNRSNSGIFSPTTFSPVVMQLLDATPDPQAMGPLGQSLDKSWLSDREMARLSATGAALGLIYGRTVSLAETRWVLEGRGLSLAVVEIDFLLNQQFNGLLTSLATGTASNARGATSKPTSSARLHTSSRHTSRGLENSSASSVTKKEENVVASCFSVLRMAAARGGREDEGSESRGEGGLRLRFRGRKKIWMNGR